MRVLIGCESSGAVRRAMRELGHDAWSCDLLPADDGDRHHLQRDVLEILNCNWDLGIFHPPCTYLTNSANGHLYRTESPTGAVVGPARWAAMIDAAAFFRQLLNAPIPMVAVENPVMNGHAAKIVGARPTQVIQPWMFGHPETKGTALWLRGLAPLVITDDVRDVMAGLPKREQARIHHMPPTADRWKLRSVTYAGIAAAMAEQWAGDARAAA
jgi:hypothetical protein